MIRLAWSHQALLGAPLLGAPILGAPAEFGEISLQWEAPPSCPARDEVARDVAALVGDAARSGVAFEAVVSREEEVFRLDLHTHWDDEREEQRTIRAVSCPALADAAVLLIAINLDPVATSGSVRDAGWVRASAAPTPPPDGTESSPPAEPPPADPPPVTKPIEETGERSPSPPRSEILTYGVRPEFVADWGSLPRLGPGAGLTLSLTWKLLRAELVGGYWPSQRATRSDLQKQGAWVDLGTAGGRMCVAPMATSVTFPVCAGIEVGAVRSRGIGTTLQGPRYATWVAATGGPTLIWSFIPRLALAIGLDVVVPITRPAVLTATGERLHAPEPVVLRPRLGLELRL